MKSPILSLTPNEVVCDICRAYRYSQGIFNEKTNAEDLVPAVEKSMQVQFLFWVLQMDYSTKSHQLYLNANNLFRVNGDWLNPKYLLAMSDDQLLRFIRLNFKPRYPNEIVKRFKSNGEKLLKEYNGNAINIILASPSASELLKRVKEFRGFGDKLANFLVRTFIDLLSLGYTDINEILPPVDSNDVRLTYEWGFIDTGEMSLKNINYVKNLWSDACKETQNSWIEFDKALWLVGSKGVRTGDARLDYLKNLGLK